MAPWSTPCASAQRSGPSFACGWTMCWCSRTSAASTDVPRARWSLAGPRRPGSGRRRPRRRPRPIPGVRLAEAEEVVVRTHCEVRVVALVVGTDAEMRPSMDVHGHASAAISVGDDLVGLDGGPGPMAWLL